MTEAGVAAPPAEQRRPGAAVTCAGRRRRVAGAAVGAGRQVEVFAAVLWAATSRSAAGTPSCVWQRAGSSR